MTSNLEPRSSVLSVSGAPAWLPPSLRERSAPVRFSFRWSKAERNVFHKRPKIPVSEWAEKHRVITMGDFKGKWKNSVNPYLSGIMDASFYPSVETIILCAVDQTGKSEVVNNCIGYAIDRAPGPALFIYPDELTAKDNSRDRIMPMIQSSPRLRSFLTGQSDDEAMTRINLQRMPIYMAWAHSASRLANKPIRYVVFDETDKYPVTAGKREGDPISKGEKRARTYRWTRKIWKISTPTIETGPIWVALTTEAQVVFDYWVPCSDCGAEQIMEERQIKIPEGEKSPMAIESRNLAWYECASCGSHWSDYHRDKAVARGRWRDRTEEHLELFEHLRVLRPRRIGFHLPAWVSRFVGLSECAAKRIQGEGDKTIRKDWCNSYCAVPWKDHTVERKEDAILKLRDDRPRGLVPSGGVVSCLTAGADTQKYGFWYEIRAWGYGLTMESWQIREGYVETWEALLQLMCQDAYRDIDGNEHRVRLVVQDAMGVRERTIEVYDMARMHRNFLLPFKGEDRLSTPHIWSKIDVYPGTTKPIPGGIRLLRADVNFFKNQLAAKLEIAPNDPGAWHLHSETTEAWGKHMCAEFVNDKGLWECASGRDNHGWDCSVYNLVAADVLGVRFWPKPAKPQGAERKAQSEAQRPGWLPQAQGWLKR